MQRLCLLVLLLSSMFSAAHAQQPAITVTSPVPFQVIQRQGVTGSISISGTTRTGSAVEARFNGGDWQVIAQAAGGSFSGVLADQPQGQGVLEVRLAGAPDAITAVPDVGIGDVFIIAGQSNASGRGDNLHTASGALKGGLFGNDYRWRELADPTDDDSGQVDRISIDWEAGGSVWTMLGARYMDELGIPVAFVPTAKGGSSITAWMPAGNSFHRGTLYGSMAHRAQLTGARAVLWWQGETDALDGMTQADYAAHLDRLATAIQRDLGVPLVPCLLQNSMGIADENEAALRRATAETAAAHPNVIIGPDLSDLATDDQYHLRSDANLQAAAARWWDAIRPLVG